ncbi:RidA family protein [Streptomyces malaysiensis]|uniref:RidA family protein n=1 Tax=Streptomyces malaysiensis subsp. samsunensis TaxID=459658 RepID=A0A9X2RT28_STRMQ|nr:RidA family protein [Streptomyces samsunensis]MCQ8830021.1 RidA family protein [Streptomyces samsunensis]
MNIRSVSTHGAPTVGFSSGTKAPLSQAVVHGSTVYCSGTGPLDPETRTIVSEDFEAQAEQTLRNLLAVVEAAGGGKETILKCNCYLRSGAYFPAFNAVYRRFFEGLPHFPARTTVIAAAHRDGVLVEIECVAAVTEG